MMMSNQSFRISSGKSGRLASLSFNELDKFIIFVHEILFVAMLFNFCDLSNTISSSEFENVFCTFIY